MLLITYLSLTSDKPSHQYDITIHPGVSTPPTD